MIRQLPFLNTRLIVLAPHRKDRDHVIRGKHTNVRALRSVIKLILQCWHVICGKIHFSIYDAPPKLVSELVPLEI